MGGAAKIAPGTLGMNAYMSYWPLLVLECSAVAMKIIVVTMCTSPSTDCTPPLENLLLDRLGATAPQLCLSRMMPMAQSARDDAAIDPVAIAHEIVRSLIPRKCFRYLTRNPFGRGICCDIDPDEVSAV